MNRSTVINPGSLRRLKTLSSLTPAQLERLAASLAVKEVRRKERIFESGQLADIIYLLISGVAKVAWLNQEGRQVLVTLLPPGVFLGVGSLFPQIRHPFRCEAFSDCTIGAIKPETLMEILLGVPFETYLCSNEVTLGRLWGMLVRCIQGIGLSLEKRLALELLELAASFGVEDARGTILTVRPTHEDLANSIGVSRQRVSQCLSKFQRQGLIKLDGRRVIIVAGKLRQFVGQG